jgi:hypothetical protein
LIPRAVLKREKSWILCKYETEVKESQALVAHACNPSYLGSWDQENFSSRPAGEIVWDSISKITKANGVARAVECLLCKHKALSLKPSPAKKNK